MNLRPNRSAMVEAVRAAWTEYRAVLGVLPTGVGKTETAIDNVAAAASPTARVVVLTERSVRCNQWAGPLRCHGIADVGVRQVENTKRLGAPLVGGSCDYEMTFEGAVEAWAAVAREGDAVTPQRGGANGSGSDDGCTELSALIHQE
jgi:hypothetical protein